MGPTLGVESITREALSRPAREGWRNRQNEVRRLQYCQNFGCELRTISGVGSAKFWCKFWGFYPTQEPTQPATQPATQEPTQEPTLLCKKVKNKSKNPPNTPGGCGGVNSESDTEKLASKEAVDALLCDLGLPPSKPVLSLAQEEQKMTLAGDRAHAILIESGCMDGLTVEMDLMVRRNFASEPISMDWEHLARECALRAKLEGAPIKKPGKMWLNFVQMWLKIEKRERSRSGGGAYHRVESQVVYNPRDPWRDFGKLKVVDDDE